MSLTPPVMLFCAGFGTRMAPLTDRLPKPLIPVAGQPLVDHALDLVAGVELTRIVANTHYKTELLEPYLARRGVVCVHESEILETGGGLKNALSVLGSGPVITLNSDSVWSGANPVRRLVQAWDPAMMDALLVLVPVAQALGHNGEGDFSMDDDGRLARGHDWVYSGLQMLKTDHLARIPDRKFSLNLVWNRIGADGRLFGLPHQGQWCDVGRPESIALAEDMLRLADV